MTVPMKTTAAAKLLSTSLHHLPKDQEIARLQAAQLYPQQRDAVGPRRDDGILAHLLARHQDRFGTLEQVIVKLNEVVVLEVGDDIVTKTRIENELIGAVASGKDV